MPTHYSGTPQQVLALDTAIKLTRAAASLEACLFEGAFLEGLTPSQFLVLDALYHLGPLSQGEVSRKVFKSTGNITLVLDNLEKRAYLRREREQRDRRVVTLHLTPGGELVIRRVLPQVAARLSALMSALSPQQQQTLADLCRTLGLSLG